MFCGISRGSLGSAGGGVSIFNRVAGLRPVALLTGRLWHGCFPVGFVGFLGDPFLQSTSGRLLLLIPLSYPLLAISPDNFLHKIKFHNPFTYISSACFLFVFSVNYVSHSKMTLMQVIDEHEG